LDLIYRLFKCYDILIKADSFKDDMIFDYDSLMIDENKENDELINKLVKMMNLKRRKRKIIIIRMSLIFLVLVMNKYK